MSIIATATAAIFGREEVTPVLEYDGPDGGGLEDAKAVGNGTICAMMIAGGFLGAGFRSLLHRLDDCDEGLNSAYGKRRQILAYVLES